MAKYEKKVRDMLKKMGCSFVRRGNSKTKKGAVAPFY